MSNSLSPNTQAVLLLTAPLIAGRGADTRDLLTPGEYKRLASHLRDRQLRPEDLVSREAHTALQEHELPIDVSRLERLLARGFQLSQAVDRWQTRAIWVVSAYDAEYPKRLKDRLKGNVPPLLYGCGERAILDDGGLAVVGSRDVDAELVAYTEDIGRLTARAQRTLISGGARGIDQAAMRGALECGGEVAGVLADSLERAAMNREHRNALMEGHLVLISPYDPNAGFNVGNAMQRNKLIYALSDAAMVVNSDYQKGGTWAGAVEQLDKFRFVPVFVRSEGGTALDALRKKGALPWPNPEDADAFIELLSAKTSHAKETVVQEKLSFVAEDRSGRAYDAQASGAETGSVPDSRQQSLFEDDEQPEMPESISGSETGAPEGER